LMRFRWDMEVAWSRLEPSKAEDRVNFLWTGRKHAHFLLKEQKLVEPS